MFVVILTYVGSLEAVDALLPEHNRFLRENYDKGVFLLSGPQVPRQGGLILARAESREALQAILAADPFGREGVARYDVIEFVAKMGAPECAGLVQQA